MEEQCDVLDCYKDLHIDNTGRLVKIEMEFSKTLTLLPKI
jgi:hypothetical protein